MSASRLQTSFPHLGSPRGRNLHPMSSPTAPRYHAVSLEPEGDLSRHPPPRWQAVALSDDGSEGAYPLWSKVATKLDWRVVVPLALLCLAGIGELVGDDYAPSQLPALISSQVDAYRASPDALFDPKDPVSYYSQPGFLTVDHNRTIDVHRQARWLPISALDAIEEQSATGLEGQLDLGLGVEDGFDLLDAYRSVIDHDGGYTSREAVDSPAFDYLRNKNVLLFGDSQDRFTIDYMCELLHGTLTLRDFFTPSHGMSLGRIAPQEFWRPAPHVCQLPAAWGNTTIWSVMTYGSFNEEDTWALLRPGEGPDELEVRMNLTAEAFAKEGIKLDLVLFHTLCVLSGASQSRKSARGLFLAVARSGAWLTDNILPVIAQTLGSQHRQHF